jgi:hypothetical protein
MYSTIFSFRMELGDNKIDALLNFLHLELLHTVESKSFIINVEGH